MIAALRSLLRRPALTALAVAGLALGVAAHTASFGVLWGVLLRPPPFADPGRLFFLYEARAEDGAANLALSVPAFEPTARGAGAAAGSPPRRWH